MVNNWKHLNFFDKNGKYLNFNYNQSEDMWSGTMYLPEVSIGLFEVGQIFILEEFVNKTITIYGGYTDDHGHHKVDSVKVHVIDNE